MSVEVIVPWRGGEPDREAAWEWVGRQWLATGWKVTVAEAPDGEWCKAAAVNPAARRSTADVLVIADADVWCDGIPAAVRAVRQGAPWAMPHSFVNRLTAEATAAVLAGGTLGGDLDEKPYAGHEGGGITVLRRPIYLDIPLDPRFKGWSREDDSWALALHRLIRPPWRGDNDLWHLYHAPQPRSTRVRGSPETEALYMRYREARTPERMRRLVDEAKEADGDSVVDHHHHRAEASR